MWIKQLKVKDFRAFQKETTINLSSNVTAIAGLNGIGKSTLLAILTNIGELPSKYKTLFNSRFRGEFSSVIMYDSQQDDIGEKVEITLDGERPVGVPKKMIFRAIIQNYNDKTKRYRLVPKKDKEQYNSEAKIPWPSYYLGLSRLIPLGEHKSGKKVSIPEHYKQEITRIHSEILSENLDIEHTESSNLDIGIGRLKSTIKTDYYGFASNSNGQDNTGQIIEAVLSFDNLKKELNEEYLGGILAIDEIDASLHPAAQNKLLDWLVKKSIELDLQIIFTTHSLTLLEHMSKNNRVMINYLSVSKYQPGIVKVKENPDPGFYRHNLQETYSLVPPKTEKVCCFLEDDTARWFFKNIVQLSIPINSSKVDYLTEEKISFMDVSIPWNSLIHLFHSDQIRYHNDLFVLDPDLSKNSGDLKNELDRLKIFDLPIDAVEGNVFILPGHGNVKIESILRNYLKKLPADSSIYDCDFFVNNGINYDVVQEDLINLGINEKTSEKKKDKVWFKNIGAPIADTILNYWFNDHSDEIIQKLSLINEASARMFHRKN